MIVTKSCKIPVHYAASKSKLDRKTVRKIAKNHDILSRDECIRRMPAYSLAGIVAGKLPDAVPVNVPITTPATSLKTQPSRLTPPQVINLIYLFSTFASPSE